MPAFKLTSRLLLAVWLMLILSQPASPTALKIEPSSSPLNKALIRRLTDIARESPRESAAAEVSELLTGEGYVQATVRVSADTLIVSAGPLYRIENVDIAQVDAAGRLDTLHRPEYRGRIASRTEIEWLRKEILRPWHENGYYFASLGTEQVSLGDQIIGLKLRLISGPQVVIERVRFKGLKRSSPRFVTKLSGLRPGDRLIASSLEDAIDRIESSGYLRSDSAPVLTPNDNYDGVEILFHLSETKANSLELGGGYLPGDAGVKGELVGRLDFRSPNLFGTGRRVELLVERKDRASSHLAVLYGQPLFVPDHLELLLRMEQEDYDSAYYSFSAEAGMTLFYRNAAQFSGGVTFQRVEPQESSQPSSRTLSGWVQYCFQDFDYEPNPAGGRQILLKAAYLRHHSRPDSLGQVTTVITNETIFEIGADTYLPLAKPMFLRVNLDARVRVTNRELINYSEQFKLGGFGSLRGYRQDQFAGHRTLLGQVEIRLRPSPQAAFYAFADEGIIYFKRQIAAKTIRAEILYRFGYGFGLFAGSETAYLNLELGWGQNDDLSDGKVHLGLVTRF